MQAGFIIIDKPKDWTSHDVVAKMRGLLHERKIGHLGTLDPISTGVLVLAVGREATKQIQNFMKADKDYEVTMELGKKSDTFDTEGEVIETGFDLSTLNESQIRLAMAKFWGDSMQIPPRFSAKKIKGQKAYNLARAGVEFELKPVPVTITCTKIEMDLPVVRFNVTVTSGTYIRSLVNDIGEALKCGAVMTELRRTRVGDFKIEGARRIEDFMA